jgi:alanine racemase
MFGSVDTSRAWAEIDLDAMTSNLGVIRTHVGPDTALLLVAKADAYGHGAVAVAHHGLTQGVDAIGVTTCGEALELRRAGIRARTVVLGPAPGQDVLPAIEAGVELAVPSDELCTQLERAARASGSGLRARVHVKVDTGLNRLGVAPGAALRLLARVRRSPALELAGVMTHLAAVDGGAAATRHQLSAFDALLLEAHGRGLLAGRDVWIHAANSAAALSGLGPRYDAVRVGMAAYGVAPDPALDRGELVPVLSVRTRIVHLRDLEPGAQVGYGGTWTARRPTRIAVVPIGYDDGVNWRLGNRGELLLSGRRVPIVGRVSMDYTTLDVTDVPEAAPGDRVTLLGRDGEERIRVEELAELAGTIPYEITCSLGKRVALTYVGGALPQRSSAATSPPACSVTG